MPAFVIGKTCFASKSAARSAIQSILYHYKPGDRIDESDGQFLLEVISLHPHASLKIGCGIEFFSVEQYPWNQGFSLIRVDGTKTDWSFLVCLTPPTPAQEANKGFRTEIRVQIKDFRCALFREGHPVCALTGVPLINDLSTHIDHHDPTYDELLKTFLEQQHLELHNVAVNATQDNDLETYLVDRTLAMAWQTFHKKHAKLRAVTKQANLKRRR